jgi:glycosyltransferase involved in cell wall biosynthesis
MDAAKRTKAVEGGVLLVAPAIPPYGGMALQARQLHGFLRAEGREVVFLAVNFPLGWLDRLPGIRTAVRFALMWGKLARLVPRAQVVHVYAASWLYFFLVVYPAVIVTRAWGRRVILNYRGGDADRFLGAWGMVVLPAFRWASIVTVPSDFLAGVISRRIGIAVSIVPNFLDTGIFQYRKRRHFSPKFLVTRHLERIYDVESVLRAFHVVQQRYPDASLCIAGTGGEETALRRLAGELHLVNIQFLGHVEHRKLPVIYDKCDVYLNASRVDNFPAALLEASAAGLVVVSTAPGGIPSIYRDGETALLVAPGDWRALAQSALRIIESPDLGCEISANAAALVQQFTWPEVRKALYAAYDFPLNETGVPAEANRGGIPCTDG